MARYTITCRGCGCDIVDLNGDYVTSSSPNQVGICGGCKPTYEEKIRERERMRKLRHEDADRELERIKGIYGNT